MIERWSDGGYWMYKDPNGEWVKYEDVKKTEAELAWLKELNREMDIKEPCEKIVELEAENARLNEALHSIHNYIANPEHYDILTHMLAIDKMALNALYGGEG